MIEIKLYSKECYGNPFLDVDVFAEFTSPNGQKYTVQGFFNGDHWIVRFKPNMAGGWGYKTYSNVINGDFISSGQVHVELPIKKGFLRAIPNKNWGLWFDSDEEFLLFGDTQYNLFGVAHCGVDIRPILARRKLQGFNFLRTRIQVSPFHPGSPTSSWQNKSTWLWGGSPQMPDYTRFNVEYFETVESVLNMVQEMGFGLEVILEAWLMEMPFNDRGRFLPEHEELFFKYVIARLACFPGIYMWCVANEYNLYTSNINDSLATKYALRLAKLIKQSDCYQHPVAVHVTMAENMNLPFMNHFRSSTDVDVLLLQYWGDISSQRSSKLCAKLEHEIRRSVIGSDKVNVMSEYGYEVFEGTGLSPEIHNGLGPDHTRRGAWRSLFSGVHLICGFENTWGPVFTLENEPKGAEQLIHLKNLFTEHFNFGDFKPDYDFSEDNSWPEGEQPLCLSSKTHVLIYLPTGKACKLKIEEFRSAQWYATQTGVFSECKEFVSPPNEGLEEMDWVLVLEK